MYTDKIDEIKEELTTRKVEIAGLKDNLENTIKINEKLTGENDELSIEKEEIEKELDELKDNFDTRIQELKDECEKGKEDLRINIKSRDDSIAIKQERIDRLELEIAELKEDRSIATDKAKALGIQLKKDWTKVKNAFAA